MLMKSIAAGLAGTAIACDRCVCAKPDRHHRQVANRGHHRDDDHHDRFGRVAHVENGRHEGLQRRQREHRLDQRPADGQERKHQDRSDRRRRLPRHRRASCRGAYEKLKFVNEPWPIPVPLAPRMRATAGIADDRCCDRHRPPARQRPRRPRLQANPWYPDHAVFNATKDELKSMPEFKYSRITAALSERLKRSAPGFAGRAVVIARPLKSDSRHRGDEAIQLSQRRDSWLCFAALVFTRMADSMRLTSGQPPLSSGRKASSPGTVAISL